MPKPLVLVPGACLGGWAWRDVAARLRARGHDEVFQVTLTGVGERVHLARPEVDLETHIADVVNLLDYEDLQDAVLVGHSYAGVVVAGVADRRPQRLYAVVYLDTGPLPDGMAIADVQSPEQRDRQRRDVDERGDGWRWPVPDRVALEPGTYGSVSGLEDRHFALLAERGTPQPYATFTTPLRLEHERPPGVRRVAIFAAANGMGVAALRELIAAGDPRGGVFAAPDWELHELPTGHWAMFSAPDALGDLLHEIAERPPRAA
jgi:pimeloyl-ACP methyl ester carboxylesterase